MAEFKLKEEKRRHIAVPDFIKRIPDYYFVQPDIEKFYENWESMSEQEREEIKERYRKLKGGNRL